MQGFKALLLSLILIAAAGAQEPPVLGERFFRTAITLNDKPLLAASIFEDTRGNLIVKGAPLAAVIARAYGVPEHLVVDGPEWAYASHLYDIEAEPPPTELLASDEAQMLQALLADSFMLQLRRETRELTRLVLTVDAERQQQLARDVDCVEAERRRQVAMRSREQALRQANRPYCMVARTLADGLARLFGEPVVDLTGQSTIYLAASVQLRPMPGYDLATARAMLESAGLILQRRSVPLEALVITSIERPVLNPIDR